MNVKRFLSLSILAATCAFTFGPLSAQSLSRDAGPAETPPASFKASQYVDSKGCVYIRAGVDGNVSWVPRVSRARKVVCGMSPSLGAASRTAAAAKPKAAAPVQIGASLASPKSPPPAAVKAIRPARTTVASALAPKPVRTVASKPVVRKRPVAQVQRVNRPLPNDVRIQTQRTQVARVQAPQPRIVRVAPTAVAAAPRRVATTTQRAATTKQTCRGASAVSQRYIGGRGTAVRCGPQAGSLVTMRAGDVKNGSFRTAGGQQLNTNTISPNAVVVPRHVYEQQQAARLTSPTPKGYRKAWSDDRLNTRRTHQTLGGKARMDVVWSKTVPRRLIVLSTGRDVTRSFPGLRYPFTSLAQQAAAQRGQGLQMGTTQQRRVVSTKGTVAKRVVRRQIAAAPAARKQVRVSTRSTAPRKPAQAAGKRFVQVGTYGVASNAQNAAGRLQRMGLPVRIGNFTRGGKQMRIVLAGPFASGAHTNGALTALRNAGYRDAFARN